METKLTKIKVKSLTDNIFKLLDDDWMLITAGNSNSFNTMTASWGTFGMLWNKPIAISFIRPQRYTIEFVNLSDFFTLSFFPEGHKDILNFCGNHTGRNTDKIKETGLTPVSTEHGNIYFSQARLVLECRKLYSDNIKPENFVKSNFIKEIYPKNDFHQLFIGEIINCFSSDVILKEKGIIFEEGEIDNL
jgi:flavin reductase (DIM6/NTAB) family NADH-FMN oxidoreductase RutF